MGACAGLALALLSSTPLWAQAPVAEIAVRGIRPRRDASEIKLTAEQARAQAGSHDDPAKAIENFPGLARASFGSDQLVLWGASAEDSRVYVDGVEIPQLFHGSGIRSTVNGNLLQSVSLSPGAYGADYGRAIGGMVRLETRDLSDGYHAAIDASTLDASAVVSGSVSRRVRVALGARYGLLDRSSSAVSASDIGEFFAIPRYHDYQAKLQVALGTRESLDITALGSGDELERVVSSSDPGRVRRADTSQTFQRLYLRYRRVLDDGASVEVVPWVGRDQNRSSARFGEAPAELEERSVRFGLRAEHRSRPLDSVLLRLGLDVSGSRAQLDRRGSLTIPAREGDVSVFGQPPSEDSNSDSWQTTIVDVAPYLTLDWELGPLTLTPGLRIDGYLLEASRNTPRIGQTPAIGGSSLQAEIEPRVSARLRMAPGVALLGAAGVYSQAPQARDLSAVFGTPTLGPEDALHASLGEAVEFTSTLSINVTAFYRSFSDLGVRDPTPVPKLAQALLDTGVGQSYGMQVLLVQKPWHGFSASLAYTLSRSERRDTPEARARLFDFDEPHVLTALANRAFGDWSLGARFRYASGLPRTPVTGAFFDLRSANFRPIFGVQNSERLPDFWQLDVRLDRKFRLSERTQLLAYLELLNVMDRKNGEEYVYSQNYARRGVVTGLPFVGVIGARLEL